MIRPVVFTNNHVTRDITDNFFAWHAEEASSAQLACPFFSRPEPIETLRKAGCEDIKLLVRLCSITQPDALVRARAAGATVRFYTSEDFHAKFYILGHHALLGSANLTDRGMLSNRELSIELSSTDERFAELPGYFDELWASASALTTDALKRFTAWHKAFRPPKEPPIEGIDPSGPPTVHVSSRTTSRERTYIETFRKSYDEKLIPAHRQISGMYLGLGLRHPEFAHLPIEYEFDRFLNWIKLEHTTEEDLFKAPFRTRAESEATALAYANKWFGTEGIKIDEDRTSRIARLKEIFADEESFADAEPADVLDALEGCAAFVEQERFTKGGLEPLRKAFKSSNSELRLRESFGNLAFGRDQYVERIYDSIYSPRYKLAHFGKSCVLELFGWINTQNVPPFNGRTIKALRFLGFDVMDGH